jgi:carboxymethylenebutenolidase
MAVPTTGGGPGVIVIHAWWGLTEFFRQTCDRLAQEGFLAYAPDLYSGATAKTIEEAERLSSKLDHKLADRKVVEAVDYLLSHPRLRGDRIGVIGFSMGAAFALTLACNRPNSVSAVVLFYGTGTGKFDEAKAAFIGDFAENDNYESPEYVSSLEKSLVVAGRKVTFYTYVGKKHWFFEENVPSAYDSDAAKLAWERTLAFLRTQLP